MEQEQITELTEAIRDLRGETSSLRGAVSGHTRMLRRRTLVIAALLVVFAVVGMVGAGLLSRQLEQTRRAAADQRRLCPLLELLVPSPGEVRPSTARGVEIAESARELSRQLSC